MYLAVTWVLPGGVSQHVEKNIPGSIDEQLIYYSTIQNFPTCGLVLHRMFYREKYLMQRVAHTRIREERWK